MKKRGWIVDIVQRLPQGTVSRAWGWLARRQQPRLGVTLLKHVFVRATGINMAEADGSIDTYDTLEELFIRKLRHGAHRIDGSNTALVSPVDATVGISGVVTAGTCLQLKGRSYSLATLLGDSADAARFEGGAYATFYLAPRDYHRIHAPVSGQVCEAMVIPGALLPVFPEALDRVDGLFARNERIITYIETPNAGRVGVVKVGATLVGRITLAYDPELWGNRPNQTQRRVQYSTPHLLQKGGELGAFELGSTVIVLTEPKRVVPLPLPPGTKVRMGQQIATIVARAPRSKMTKTTTRPRKTTGNGAQPTRKGQRRD